MTRWLLAVFAILCAPYAGAQTPSFEGALNAGRLSILASHDGARLRSAMELRRAEAEAQQLVSSCTRVRWALGDIRRRTIGHNPQRDPLFVHDLRRTAWQLQQHAYRLRTLNQQLARTENWIRADPGLHPLAERVAAQAGHLRSEGSLLENEGRWARFELSRMAFTREAWDVERASLDASRLGADIHNAAIRIARKVKG